MTLKAHQKISSTAADQFTHRRTSYRHGVDLLYHLVSLAKIATTKKVHFCTVMTFFFFFKFKDSQYIQHMCHLCVCLFYAILSKGVYTVYALL